MQKERPRCLMKIVYSCFDCNFFMNKSSHIDISKEKYNCLVEQMDFSFNQMSPNGVPSWCPLPMFGDIKKATGFKPFSDVFDKLERRHKEDKVKM